MERWEENRNKILRCFQETFSGRRTLIMLVALLLCLGCGTAYAKLYTDTGTIGRTLIGNGYYISADLKAQVQTSLFGKSSGSVRCDGEYTDANGKERDLAYADVYVHGVVQFVWTNGVFYTQGSEQLTDWAYSATNYYPKLSVKSAEIYNAKVYDYSKKKILAYASDNSIKAP